MFVLPAVFDWSLRRKKISDWLPFEENFDVPVIGILIFFEDLSLLLIGSAGLFKPSLVSTPQCFTLKMLDRYV